jgi:hypothetical protein
MEREIGDPVVAGDTLREQIVSGTSGSRFFPHVRAVRPFPFLFFNSSRNVIVMEKQPGFGKLKRWSGK